MSHRRNPGELEIGVTDALAKHTTAYLAVDHAAPVPEWLLKFERKRPLWLREMIAEAFGVFAYVYCGVSVNASFALTTAAGEAGFGSLLNVAFGFAFGIAFAIITSATTSGGHFNPAITVSFAVFQGFPWRKVPRYIFAQVFGSFLACMIIYAQWNQQLKAYAEAAPALGIPLVSAAGPAGIFCAIPGPTQNMGSLFAVEWFVDAFLAVVIWSALDPNNAFISPASAPFVIGFAYFVMILGFAANTLSTNLARDLGARCVAAVFYGREVFTIHNHYAAIAILVNIPATLFGVTFYQLNMGDANKLVNRGHALHEDVHRELQRERAVNGHGAEPGEFESRLRQQPSSRANGGIKSDSFKHN